MHKQYKAITYKNDLHQQESNRYLAHHKQISFCTKAIIIILLNDLSQKAALCCFRGSRHLKSGSEDISSGSATNLEGLSSLQLKAFIILELGGPESDPEKRLADGVGNYQSNLCNFYYLLILYAADPWNGGSTLSLKHADSSNKFD